MAQLEHDMDLSMILFDSYQLGELVFIDADFYTVNVKTYKIEQMYEPYGRLQ